MVSPSYVKREWTRDELKGFPSTPAAAGGLYLVEILPLDSEQDYPAELAQITRIAFWTFRGEAQTPVTLQADLDPDRYYARVEDLSEVLKKRFRLLAQADRPAAQSPRLQNLSHPGAVPTPLLRNSSKVFISYRGDDSTDVAGRIYDRISKRLGRDRVFFDIDSIKPGIDFVKYISQQVGACDALVVIIGKGWLTAMNEQNERRLDDPNDFVRIEIETALSRDIPVIPVLVGGEVMPREKSLPEKLKPLARRQSVEVSSNARFDSDVRNLIDALPGAADRNRRKRK
jgi:TIR domain